MAAHLALGRTLAESAELAQQYVAGAIQRAMDELESLADGKKVEYWRAIIGEQFPATL